MDASPIDGWAYADRDEARDHPRTAAWGYVDKTVYRCHNCRNEWTVAGEYRPHLDAEGAQVRIFKDDDAGYSSWVAASPRGYVVNCQRKPGPNYLILHRAHCHSITELQVGKATFTDEYIKVCSTNRPALDRWAQDTVGAKVTPCQLCM